MNRGRSKSFRCFRPVAIDDDDDDGSLKSNCKDVPGDLVFTCLPTVGDKHNTMVIPKLPDDNVVVARRCRNEKSRRSFSRVLKAVLFETSLAKKIRKRSSGRQNPRSTDLSTKSNKITTKERNLQRDQSSGGHDNCQIDPNHSSSGSSSSSISLCCSCASSISSNSRSSYERNRSFRANPIESKQVHGHSTYCTLSCSKKKIAGCYRSDVGLCLLLICLLVLVFWGKVCAIFCTSTWLYLTPGRSHRVDPPEKVVDLPDRDSKKYKKRVVMEGLLERNRL